LWQAHAATAEALAACGDLQEMDRQRTEAERIILEIAGEFERQDLRDAYLRSNLAKLPAA
jgi:hypothetical protein